MPTSHVSALRRLLALCLVALAVLLTSTPRASAQDYSDVADEADAQFRLGVEAYKQGQFERAVAHYFMSNRLAPNRNVIFNVARCYEQMQRYVEAFRYYQDYAAGEMADDERAAVHAALERVSKSVSVLEVTTDPPGATLYVNRKDLGARGTTPRTLAVEAGEYVVIVERDGYLSQERVGVTTRVGESTLVHTKLERVLGELVLDGTPPRAQVFVEDAAGNVQGALPAVLPLTPGDHRVEVTAPGYGAEVLFVTIAPNQQTKMEVHLERQTGTLVVQAAERDALIRVDGEPAGFTPAVIDGVPSGKHQLRVEASGFRPYEVEVEIVVDDRTVVAVELEVADDVAAASRAVERIQEAPASVSTITQREIDSFGYTDLADAMVGVRGFAANDDLTYASLGVRGFNLFSQYGNRVLLQLDGHTLNDDWLGASYVGFDLMTDLHMVEQIEIVRGAGSALYGTGAFFGVVNLVTPRKVRDAQVRVGTAMVDAGAIRFYGDAATPLGDNAGVWIAGGGIEAQGRDYASPAQVGNPATPDGVAHDVGGFDAATAMAKGYWGAWTLQGYFNQRDKQIPTGSYEVLFGHPGARTLDRRSFAELRFEPNLSENSQLFVRAFYDYYLYDAAYPYLVEDGGTSTESYRGHWTGLDTRGVFRPAAGLRLIAGASYDAHFQNRTVVDNEEDPSEMVLDVEHPMHVFSGYATTDYALAPWLRLSAGGRFDGWYVLGLPTEAAPQKGEDRLFYSLSPRIAAVFSSSTDTFIKLMGGRAFRAPSVYEMTYNDGGFTQIPAANLEPETVYTGELELTRRFGGAFWLTAAGYLNHITHLIVIEGEGDAVDPLRFANQSDVVQTVGFELEVRREFRHGWMMSAQYSFQRTRVADIVNGDALPNAPVHVASTKLVTPIYAGVARLATRLTADLGRLDRELNAADPSVVWDIALTGEVTTLGLRYSAGVRNLLGWRYRQPVGDDILDLTVPQQSRTFVVDVSVAF